ncbi:amino acid-binding ACT domain protein [Hymenobacter roseosalivarius DSM 11622]|uniref:Amino acid-binding ACT domain protein n=1 Tax=Hymenobacter roseosalivarius DSM 11622 TaxID=645990 RepID=A0A1W1UVP9_9BACT|nr:ACT domain-containing protein [Hymenobacter roseosalivarius]SMB85106.1 amino acid-binding ACT domain protein [Hymenobacter roseosalivarius DSM 11622]
MTGEQNLDQLLRGMQPVLLPDEYVFCTLPPGEPLPAELTPVGTFREAEGLTAIVPKATAEQTGLPYSYPCCMITLNVHSSLEAVGFLARITGALAAHGISVNAVSAFYHDHLFVPTDRAEEAMRVLHELSS